MDFTNSFKGKCLMKNIYELILNFATPLAQEVKHSNHGDSLISEKFQIEMDSRFISIWTSDENVHTIGSSLGNLKDFESALRIGDLNDRSLVFRGLDAHKDTFEFVKNLLA